MYVPYCMYILTVHALHSYHKCVQSLGLVAQMNRYLDIGFFPARELCGTVHSSCHPTKMEHVNPPSSMLSHPITLNLPELNLLALIIAFTSPYSAIRPFATPAFLFLHGQLILTCFERTQSIFWAIMLSGNSASYFLQYLETALLSQWNYESYGPLDAAAASNHGKNVSPSKGSVWQRLKFGAYAAFSYRCCGTAHGVKNVPPFPIK